MYIKRLELLNFQVIEQFSADFDGTVYFVTGDNELGKSTLLKAIGALLTGQRDDVLRNGASKGFAKMVVGDDGEEYDVQLSFTEANPRGTLTIKQKTTGMATNNVSRLQRIFGYQDFDAVEFSRWSETADGRRKQIAVVKALLPEKVRNRIAEIDESVKTLKEERTGVNRDVKTFAGFVDTMAKQLDPDDLTKYAEPVDVTELMERQETNAKLIEKAKTARAAIEQRKQQNPATSKRKRPRPTKPGPFTPNASNPPASCTKRPLPNKRKRNKRLPPYTPPTLPPLKRNAPITKAARPTAKIGLNGTKRTTRKTPTFRPCWRKRKPITSVTTSFANTGKRKPNTTDSRPRPKRWTPILPNWPTNAPR